VNIRPGEQFLPAKACLPQPEVAINDAESVASNEAVEHVVAAAQVFSVLPRGWYC
jgi:hypothetical protein